VQTHGAPVWLAQASSLASARKSGMMLHRFDDEDLTMSPTYFVVRNAQLDEELKAAQLAGNTPLVQELLTEKTSLYKAMYG
jgi:hypothetical protein